MLKPQIKMLNLVGWIERNIPGYMLANYITHHKKEPPNETLV